MVLQGLLGFASSLVIAAVAIAGICYTVNYVQNQLLSDTAGPSRKSRGGPSSDWKGYDSWEGVSCTICLSNVHGNSTRKLSCGHLFHDKCIDGWFSHTPLCPNCRQKQPTM